MTPGEERTCPHCRATILRSAAVCPICEHSLHYDRRGANRARGTVSALNVEGTVQHPGGTEVLEYSMVLSIRNERGEEIARQMVGVGALGAGEWRVFTLGVEVTKGR